MNLDDSLAAWAASVRLPAPEADAIFRRVLDAPGPAATAAAGLDPSWWHEFNVGFATRMIASTRPAHWRAALPALQRCRRGRFRRGLLCSTSQCLLASGY